MRQFLFNSANFLTSSPLLDFGQRSGWPCRCRRRGLLRRAAASQSALFTSYCIITLYLYFVIDIQAAREYPSQA